MKVTNLSNKYYTNPSFGDFVYKGTSFVSQKMSKETINLFEKAKNIFEDSFSIVTNEYYNFLKKLEETKKIKTRAAIINQEDNIICTKKDFFYKGPKIFDDKNQKVFYRLENKDNRMYNFLLSDDEIAVPKNSILLKYDLNLSVKHSLKEIIKEHSSI